MYFHVQKRNFIIDSQCDFQIPWVQPDDEKSINLYVKYNYKVLSKGFLSNFGTSISNLAVNKLLIETFGSRKKTSL